MEQDSDLGGVRWPSGWLKRLNLALIVLLLSLLIAFVMVSFLAHQPPYDYALLMNGADLFCFKNDHFHYGQDLHIYYPATFYTTFCLPYRYAEPLLRSIWMLAPFCIALWLARGRAAVLGYAPLGILLLIGQSSWLMLPLFILASRQKDDRCVPWWYGLALGLCVLKPQVGLFAALWLLYRWRRQRPVLIAGAAAMAALIAPGFLIFPGWLLEWLPNGRGFEPINLASIAFVPVQLGQLGFAPGAGGLALVWGFCLLAGAGVYVLLKQRREKLGFYDWSLLFVFVSPVLNDYDLVVLLPFIASRPRRLLLALVAGIVSWLFAMMTKRWSMSFMITLVLLVQRLWQVRREEDAASWQY